MAIKHTKVVTVPDDGTSPVGSDEWNDDHTIDNNTLTDAMVVAHTTTKITVPSRGDISIRHTVCPRQAKTGVTQPEVSASNRRNTNGKQ